MSSILETLKPGAIIRGPVLPEPVRLIEARSFGQSVKIIGKGLNSDQFYEPIFNTDHLSKLVRHTHVAITLDIYSHFLPDMQKGAAEKLENRPTTGTQNENRNPCECP